MTVEKNDVDIDRLFYWGSNFPIVDKAGNEVVTIYMRLIGDAELNISRTKAIRASAELREKLKTKGTDERFAFIPNYDDVTKEQFIEIISTLESRKFAQDAVREVQVPYPLEPKSDDPLEMQEEYQKLVDQFDDLRQSEITKFIMEKIDKRKAQLEKESIETLQKEYEKAVINELCEQEMIKKFREYCVFYACYDKDDISKRFFKSFEQYTNLPTEIKDQLSDYYQSLEIPIDTLKKSLEVTQ